MFLHAAAHVPCDSRYVGQPKKTTRTRFLTLEQNEHVRGLLNTLLLTHKQEELAAMIGISQPRLSKIASGEGTSWPVAQAIQEIAGDKTDLRKIGGQEVTVLVPRSDTRPELAPPVRGQYSAFERYPNLKAAVLWGLDEDPDRWCSGTLWHARHTAHWKAEGKSVREWLKWLNTWDEFMRKGGVASGDDEPPPGEVKNEDFPLPPRARKGR